MKEFVKDGKFVGDWEKYNTPEGQAEIEKLKEEFKDDNSTIVIEQISTLRQIYNALPEATANAKKNVQAAIDHLNNIEDVLDSEDPLYSTRIEEIKKIRYGARNILEQADVACERIQKAVQQLALNCRDGWE